MQIFRYFIYKTFNPNTNDFDKESKQFDKEVDKATERKFNIAHTLRWVCIPLILPLFIACFVFGCLSETVATPWWAILACVSSLAGAMSCIIGALFFECRADEILDEFRDNNFKEEKAECEAYNAEQEKVANEWRQAHPFEEKIRMAQTRGSSVDVAEMVKEYIKLQKGE